MKKEDIKKRVRDILKDHEEARNSDSWLIAKYWSIHHPDKVERHQEIKYLVDAIEKILYIEIQSIDALEIDVYIRAIKNKYFSEKGSIAMIKLSDIANTDHKKNRTTSPETIRRSRQMIQAKGEYPPTSEEVRSQRKISEESYYQWCLHNK